MSVFDAVELTNWEIAGRLGLATGLGALIGVQREADGQDAGIRTHALLTLGAAVFGVLSVGAFGAYVAARADSNVQVDVTRIASYLVAGVGFLAGGAIIKDGERVKGLTTAASLWVAASIGLAAGLGFFVGAILATVGGLVLLLLERPLAHLMRRAHRVTVSLVVESAAAATAIIERLRSMSGTPRRFSRSIRPDGRVVVVVVGLASSLLPALLADIESDPSVSELSYSYE